MQKLLRKLVGNRAFYAMVLAVVLPIIVQDAISSFVNLLDNLMVGRVGTDQMSGVSVANQLVFVFNLGVFGSVAGAGIFSAQFFGAGDAEGVRSCFRYKLYISLTISLIAVVLFNTAGPSLISLYLNEANDPVRVQKTLDFGMTYLRIISFGLVPFSISQCYASTLRETGETAMPMVASITAVAVNLIFNYLLIFGKLGFPRLGVAGAAWATVLSRFVELAVIAVYTHTHRRKHPFADGLYRKLTIPGKLVRHITVRGLPLLINELLWSIGMATLTQIYSLKGLDVVAAANISSTITNLFSVAFFAMGSAVGIIIGQALGAGDVERAKDYVWKLITVAVAISLVMGTALFLLADTVSGLYNTTAAVQTLAASLIRISCCLWPVIAVTHCAYFTLRSGGKTLITFLFDSGSVWCIVVPTAYLLSRFTDMDILRLYLCVQLTDFLKMAFGCWLMKKGVWINNIVSGEKT